MRKPALHPFTAAVLETLRRRRLLRPDDRVLVALSAGPDSTALLAALAQLREVGAVAAVSALHVDHGLRPGGADDAACAAATCARFGVPFESVRVTVPPGNVQAEARRARYAALRRAAAQAGATRIATGHTRSDQAETVLFRLARGAGARGLAGIPPRRGALIRPLIDRGREEGIAFLAALGVAWREDPTNASARYVRNRIRHEVLPALRAIAPAAEASLARAADLARADERALVRRARALLTGDEGVSGERLLGEPLAVRRRVVRLLWARAGGRGVLTAAHVRDVLALLRRTRPAARTLPGGRVARWRYGRLAVVAPAAPQGEPAGAVPVPGPGRYLVRERGVAVEISIGRPDGIAWPLVVRTRRPGDRIRVEGAPGSKTLKRWLIGRKVPREARDDLLVVAAGSRVLAIPALGVVAHGLGAGGAALSVRISRLA